MSTVTDLESSRRALSEGKSPTVVFEHISRAIALQLDSDLDGAGRAEPHGFGVIHAVESSLWEAYGKPPLSEKEFWW